MASTRKFIPDRSAAEGRNAEGTTPDDMFTAPEVPSDTVAEPESEFPEMNAVLVTAIPAAPVALDGCNRTKEPISPEEAPRKTRTAEASTAPRSPKSELVLKRLRNCRGATMEQLMEATGW